MNAAILVVDDEADTRELFSELLSNQGYDVTTAGDGEEALAALQTQEFDVILLDVRMPRMTGIEVLLASKELAPETEIIIITGHADLEAAVASLRSGAFDYLHKPVTAKMLLTTIARAIGDRELRATAMLSEASHAMLDAREPQRLPEIIVEMARKVMSADDVSLMLPGEGGLYVAASNALSSAIMSETRVALGERIAGRVATAGEPVLLQDVLAADPRFADVASHGRVRSSIVYPLVAAGGRLVAVLSMSRVTKDRPFQKRHLKLASVLASQVLLALENARLMQEIVQSERLASVGQLAASVVHEINNPISYVLASNTYLEEQLSILVAIWTQTAGDPDPATAFVREDGPAALEQVRQACSEIREGGLRVRDIVREIGSLARIDDASSVVFDVNESVRSALRVAGTQLQSVEITEHLDSDVWTRGNAGRISQVFVNLLVNAAQAFPRQDHNKVTVSSARSGPQIIVVVADNGSGIAREHLPRIFEAFFTTKSKATGTGLGLAISREIVRAHGGDILVESCVGKGTTFSVILPYAGMAAPKPTPTPARLRTGEHSRLMRMLFVDDEPNIRRGYERAFGKTNEIALATDGEHAWAIIEQRHDFDVIVCDLAMPNVSGVDLYERVRAAYPQLVAAFIFVTGGATDSVAQAFLSAEITLLPKPFEMRELAALIETRRPRARQR